MTGARVGIAGSDLTISQLGFGCARLVGGAEARAARQLIETALRHGVRHFDTAPTYGLGWSEGLLGDVLDGVLDVTVTTKVAATIGAPPAPSSAKQQVYRRLVRPVLARAPALKRMLLGARSPSPPPPSPPARVLSLDTLRRSLDQSEARLRRRVDILLLHEPANLIVGDDVAAHLAELVATQRLGACGGGSDGALDGGFAIGTVRQQGWTSAIALPGTTAIFHGVLRARAPGTPRARLAAALHARPDAGFLFSASSPAQIADLLAA